MKKRVSKVMVLVMVISVLTTHSAFLGFLGASATEIDEMQAAQTTAQAAVNDLPVTSDLTASEVEAAVNTALGAGYTLTWAQPLQVIRATNGAIVKLKNGSVYEEKGRVNAYDGSATGLLLIKKDGETAAVIVDRVITATYETYEFDTASQITTKTSTDRYGSNMEGFVKDAPLVIVDGGRVYNNLIRANNNNNRNDKYDANKSSYQAIKAVIFTRAAELGAAALLDLPNLEVVIFSSNVKSISTSFMQNVPNLKYVRLESTNTAGLELGESMFGDSTETSTSPIETLHIKSTASVAFTKERSLSLVGLKQVIVDTDSVDSVNPDTFRDITNNVQVVCNNAAVANAFNSVTFTNLGTGGSVSAIDRSKPTLLAAYGTIRNLVNAQNSNTTEEALQSDVDAALLGTSYSGTVSESDGVFNVTITVEDDSIVLAPNTSYTLEQVITAVNQAISSVAITNNTVKADFTAAFARDPICSAATITWPSDFAMRKSVKGAEIKVSSESIATIPGFDGNVRAILNVSYDGQNEYVTIDKTITAPIETLTYSTLSQEDEFFIYDHVLYEYNGSAEVVVIPDGVTSVDRPCFMNRAGIKALIFPEGIVYLSESSCSGMEDLEAVYLSDTCTNLGISSSSPLTQGGALFRYNHKLKYVRLSPYIEEIPFYTFSGVSSLEEFYFPEGLKRISTRAFWTNEDGRENHISDVVLPASLEEIATYAFAGKNGGGVVHYNTFSILNKNLGFVSNNPELYPNAGPFGCWLERPVTVYVPKGAAAEYCDEINRKFTTNLIKVELEQTLSQAAIDMQRLLKNYPALNETDKDTIDAAIAKLLNNDNLAYTWVEPFGKQNATTSVSGSLSGQIKLYDTSDSDNLTFTLNLNSMISNSMVSEDENIDIIDDDDDDNNDVGGGGGYDNDVDKDDDDDNDVEEDSPITGYGDSITWMTVLFSTFALAIIVICKQKKMWKYQ